MIAATLATFNQRTFASMSPLPLVNPKPLL